MRVVTELRRLRGVAHLVGLARRRWPRGRRPDLRSLLVAEPERLPDRIEDRVVRPRREAVLAAVLAPRGHGARLGHQRAEPLVREHVRPRRGSRAPCQDPDDVLASAGAEPAEAVGEAERARVGKLRRRLLRPVGRARCCEARQPRRRRPRDVELLFQRAGVRAQDDARRRQQGAPHVRGEVLSARHDHASGARGSGVRVGAVQRPLQPLLHRRRIAAAHLVDHDHVRGDAGAAPPRVGREDFGDEGAPLRVRDPHDHDRQVAGHAEGPEPLLVTAWAAGRRFDAEFATRVEQRGEEPLRLPRAGWGDAQLEQLVLRGDPRLLHGPVRAGRGAERVDRPQRLRLGLRDRREKVHFHHRVRLDQDLHADRGRGVERGPGAPREAAAAQRRRRASGSSAPEEACAVGLPRHLCAGRRRRGMGHRDPRILVGPRSSAEDQRLPRLVPAALHEQLGEGGVAQVVADGGQRDLGETRDRETARGAGVVPDPDAAHLDVVVRRHGHVHAHGQPVVVAVPAREVGGERHLHPGGRRLPCAGAHRDDPAGVEVLDVDPGAPASQRGVESEPRDRDPAPTQPAPAARRGEEREVSVPDRERLLRDLAGRHGPRRDRHWQRGLHLAPDQRRDRLGRRRRRREPFVEEQVRALHAGVGAQPPRERVAEELVGEGDEDHPLVVRHVRADETRRARRRRGRAEVGRLVEAERTEHPDRFEVVHVAGDGDGVDVEREQRRVRRHDDPLSHVGAQREGGHSEAAVLVGVVGVEAVVAGLGDPPGDAHARCVAALDAHGLVAGVGQERTLRGPHEQPRHEVLEHRAAPRQEDEASFASRERPPEVQPVRVGHVALRDREEAREPRLRCEQVVAVRVGHAEGGVVADPEQPARGVVEEAEVHGRDARHRPRRERRDARRQIGRGVLAP